MTAEGKQKSMKHRQYIQRQTRGCCGERHHGKCLGYCLSHMQRKLLSSRAVPRQSKPSSQQGLLAEPSLLEAPPEDGHPLGVSLACPLCTVDMPRSAKA